jgi:hypothetical protein
MIDHNLPLFDDGRPQLATLGWLCSLVPITTVIACASWSMQAGLAPACFPLLDGCLSISAACRPEPVIYLFRAVMLPMSLLLLWFWWLNNTLLARRSLKKQWQVRAVLVLSITGSSFLPLYVLFLGTEGPVYEFLRRLGIYVFFGATGMAQVLTTFYLRTTTSSVFHTHGSGKSLLLAWKLQTVIVMSMLLIGPLNLLLKEILVDSRRAENVIEWNFALAMFSWYGFHAIVCRSIVRSTMPSN